MRYRWEVSEKNDFVLFFKNHLDFISFLYSAFWIILGLVFFFILIYTFTYIIYREMKIYIHLKCILYVYMYSLHIKKFLMVYTTFHFSIPNTHKRINTNHIKFTIKIKKFVPKNFLKIRDKIFLLLLFFLETLPLHSPRKNPLAHYHFSKHSFIYTLYILHFYNMTLPISFKK